MSIQDAKVCMNCYTVLHRAALLIGAEILRHMGHISEGESLGLLL